MTRYHNINGEKIAFTAEEETARDAEEKAYATELAANQYKFSREGAYPSIQEQLDMQYWDQVNGTTTWKDAIAKVKSDYPKPS
tara:strand:+ start:683 stop:931 length:249 start_codon:yes stop_codon:yes gene_type:complete